MLKRFFKKWFRRVAIVLKLVFRIEIRFLKKGRGKMKERYFSYQKKYIDFGIKKGEKVLDIGSGGIAFPFATHLADLYTENTSHRAPKLARDKRPFTKCSVENMPFKDKEFDFVCCCQVLEHVEDPAKALDEIMRVGKRGYVETPTRASDILFNIKKGKDHHRWHITSVGNSLIFAEWQEKEKKDIGTTYFMEEADSRFKNPFQDFAYNNWDLLFNLFLWEGGFNYYVFDKDGKLIAKRTV